ncbi:MAG: hypothetical protein FWG67_02270 [Defluviitaleaceae bacterium]|nr:hypothetical protein [Defluviitaleaceae bacterium]
MRKKLFILGLVLALLLLFPFLTSRHHAGDETKKKRDSKDMIKDAIGDSWRSFVVRFDGDVYQLPAAVTTFSENGWVIEDDATEMVNTQSAKTGVRLRKRDQVMRTTVRNYDDEVQPIAHTFVTSITFSHHDAILPIELPGGITEHSTLDEVLRVFGEPDRIEKSATFTFYTFGRMWEQVNITFNHEKDYIHAISIEYAPRRLN